MKYIIVGAVAGGASTAVRLRRLDESAEIIMVEKGDYVSYANCGLPYYIGNVIKDRNKLFVQTAESFQKRFNINIKVNTEATKIDREKKTVDLLDLKTNTTHQETYDKLILSTGAVPIIPNISGTQLPNVFTVRNIKDTDLVKASIENQNTKEAIVIGGGFIGIEMLENLQNLGIKIKLVEQAPQILTMLDEGFARMAQNEIEYQGVEVFLSNPVEKITPKNNNRLTVNLKNGEEINTDLVILSIGVKPNSMIAAEAGIKIGASGGILVNEFMQTSDESVYALGDVIEFKHPIHGSSLPVYLAGPANKQGRICANNIVGGNSSSFKGSIGTTIVKVFRKTVAATGLTSRILDQYKIKNIRSITFSSSHAGYYPGAEQMSIQISFCPTNGRLYGAQIIGEKGVDKRIDVFSKIIQDGGTIDDLMEFEQAYAPPFSSAKDPVNMAGFVADNILNGKMDLFYAEQASDLSESDFLLDVRTTEEFSKGTIMNAKNIPLDDIRSRLGEIPKSSTIYLFCEIGLRGYLATRILMQNGCTVKNLSGGYRYWSRTNNVNALQMQE